MNEKSIYKEFLYPDDVLWGLQGQQKNDGRVGQAPEPAKACAIMAYNKLSSFLAHPPTGMQDLVTKGGTTNHFYLWVNDYTRASVTEEERPNSFGHRNRGPKDYSKGYYKWESTLTCQGVCVIPDDAQIAEFILEITAKVIKN